MTGKLFRLLLSVGGFCVLLYVLNSPTSTGFPPGPLFEPLNGLYRTAARADQFGAETVEIASLGGEVRILRDARGVPHIFADTDRDAVVALGYVTAQDRLFQMDFISRAALGRAAEVLGTGALSTDQFFRQIGLPWSIHRMADAVRAADDEQAELISWFHAGANAWISSLDPKDDPFEFRLLGYRPRPFQLEDALAVLAYMSYDLSYSERDLAYTDLKKSLPPESYNRLYPRFAPLAVPITSSETDGTGSPIVARHSVRESLQSSAVTGQSIGKMQDSSQPLANIKGQSPEAGEGTLFEGLIPGKGSNNWAVAGSRSDTGFPILAGDMHLNLSLPAIWYEAQLVTPSMNVYGVTIPGSPSIVEGITPTTAWAFTNTGSDQIDFYELALTDDRSGYIVDGEATPFELIVDTIAVAREESVLDTLRISRYGPVSIEGDRATAIRWSAHESSGTLISIWKMAHASDYASFETATRMWDVPMQNILFAGTDGTIAIRSTGYLPVRGGGDGSTLLDGSTRQNDWTGRVPFDELPAEVRPAEGVLTSSNQPPADSTYPHFLGHDWRDAFRSIRIDQLLSDHDRHSVEDLKSYQADVHSVQADLLIPLLSPLEGLSPAADRLRSRLIAWNRETDVESTETRLFQELSDIVAESVWDESLLQGLRKPSESTLLSLLSEDPTSIWFDHEDSPERESANDILIESLEAIADLFEDTLTETSRISTWGDEHKLVIRHLTRSTALRPLWRGPYPYPGYRETLSPAGSMQTTHSASWRVVVDLSSKPPTAFGVYPGGQSGNPFSQRYDNQIETYLNFDYYELTLPDSPALLPETDLLHETVLEPSARR